MILVDNKEIRFSSSVVNSITNIPVGNWLLNFDEYKKEFFLEKVDDFKMPSKIYGDSEELAKRYLNTFNNISGNLGIVLSGLKGTGKSLTAKEVCIQSNLPVILITEPFSGTDFNSCIASIKEECIIFIDEFEKLYQRQDDQNNMLSLLDGVFMGRKLFVFTSNETSRYSNYLLNRPGRIHYMKEYTRIEDSMLNDIILDQLKNQSHALELKNVIDMVEDANIDMVISLIRECNMYNESPKEAVKFLNIKINNAAEYNLSYTDSKGNIYEGEWANGDILARNNFYCYLEMTEETKDKNKKVKDLTEEIRLNLNLRECTLTANKTTIIISNNEGILTCTPIRNERLQLVF